MLDINRNNTEDWEKDISRSVEHYNEWFLNNAPRAFEQRRNRLSDRVRSAFRLTKYLEGINPSILIEHPEFFSVLRVSTCPPLARDRLAGLSNASEHLVDCMDDPDSPHVPPLMDKDVVREDLRRICAIFIRLLDRNLFPWVGTGTPPSEVEMDRAVTVVSDRLCSTFSNADIRMSQEERQLASIRQWLESRGYCYVESSELNLEEPTPGTFTFRYIVYGQFEGRPAKGKGVRIPVDACIVSRNRQVDDPPILIEAKSAGDFANVNKRRKEEAQKFRQLKNAFGDNVVFILFLSGYFNQPYLEYEASEGIDWIWEHRISDMEKLDL